MEGNHLIGGEKEPGTGSPFASTNPDTAELSNRVFREPNESQIRRCFASAQRHVSPMGFAVASRRRLVLNDLADALDRAESEIVEVAQRESGLDASRLTGELKRTSNQMRAFAAALKSRYDIDLTEDVDTGGDHLRHINLPIGVVVVFEASNFPLAFATLGGDTASALAAGCSVVVKAHPSHPETSEIVGSHANEVLKSYGLAGIFSVVHGPSPKLGERLVREPITAAVGFTGSLSGGRALFDLACGREAPIPVYAEMGSVNPVIVTGAAAQERYKSIAEGYASSLLQGGGQFCTKPGLLLVPDTVAGTRVIEEAASFVSESGSHVMLNDRIKHAYDYGARSLIEDGRLLAASSSGENPRFRVGANLVELRPPLGGISEVFGPLGIVVRYSSMDELVEIVDGLPGALAGAIHGVDHSDPDAVSILVHLILGVGRVVWNGYPTGVAVSPAMNHGGPYPATTSPLFTSVGLSAMRRFQRPVALQNLPRELGATLC